MFLQVELEWMKKLMLPAVVRMNLSIRIGNYKYKSILAEMAFNT